MHGVAPHMCGRVANPLLGRGAGGRSPGFPHPPQLAGPLTECPSRCARPRRSRDPNANGRRLYENWTASRPEIAWFWSIIVMGPARHKVNADGRAPTLEEAKTQFAG